MEQSDFPQAALEIGRYHFPESGLTEAEDKALDAMHALANTNKTSSRIIAFDTTSEDSNAVICGCTITDGKGKLLFDEAINPKLHIDAEYARRMGLDLRAIAKAKSFEEQFETISNTLKSAESVAFRCHSDYKLLVQETRSLRKASDADDVAMLRSTLKETGISCKKCVAAISSAISSWRQPIISQLMMGIQSGFQSSRSRAIKEITTIQKLILNHLERESAYRESRESLKGKSNSVKEQLKAARLVYRKEAQRLKMLKYAWIPADRLSKRYRDMSYQEKIVERQLARLYPQNIPASSTWRLKVRNIPTSASSVPATNSEVEQMRQILLEHIRLRNPIQREMQPKHAIRPGKAPGRKIKRER